jgi:hypothetical protein
MDPGLFLFTHTCCCSHTHAVAAGMVDIHVSVLARLSESFRLRWSDLHQINMITYRYGT